MSELEILRVIGFVLSLIALSLSLYGFWLTMHNNRRLIRENRFLRLALNTVMKAALEMVQEEDES